MILTILIIGISLLVILLEYQIGKFFGKKLSKEAGLIIGITFIVLLPLIFVGIPIIIYSNPKKENTREYIKGSITINNFSENNSIILCEVSNDRYIQLDVIDDQQKYYPTIIGNGIRLKNDPYNKVTVNGFEYLKDKLYNKFYFGNPETKEKDFTFTGYGSVLIKYIINNKEYFYLANHVQFSNGHAIILFNEVIEKDLDTV